MGTHRWVAGSADWIDTESVNWIDKRHPDWHKQSQPYIHRHGSNPAHTPNSDQDTAIDNWRRSTDANDHHTQPVAARYRASVL